MYRTYGTRSFEHTGCLNYIEFLNLNYKNEVVKHNLCSSHRCVICVGGLVRCSTSENQASFCMSVSNMNRK